MPLMDRTAELRELVEEKRRRLPESKRRKVSRNSRQAGSPDSQLPLNKQYLQEAYLILKHVNTLMRMLVAIRKPYLNVDSRQSPFVGLSHGVSGLDLFNLDNPEASWSSIRHLSNEERDQIDLQARVVLSRCAERVKELEEIEKRRHEIEASRTNPLARLLPARLLQSASPFLATSDVVAAHHAGITWYLSRRLAEVSQTQKEMQEERVKRQMERTKTLGSGAAKEVAIMGLTDGPSDDGRNGSGSWLGNASSTLASTLLGASNDRSLTTLSRQNNPSPPLTSTSFQDSDQFSDDDMELTQSQIMQFESENSQILHSMQNTLESVQLAESRLLEISALQTELVAHLTRQTELTDQLFEDAIASTGMVEKGNEQLREAKKRAKDSRIFILVFLLGASFSLLFLHYY
ncbi:hypothetical protein NEOLEDRAFT_1156717 [Neolentinus lepideus HHB14362 ss-1]|uniref:SNARE-complex protein Syntaxin-18 N-terminal domain-containing protein n=1 Tax=Neolentinus lepideus HHB14362 ss-1 TaxID=1314782 RepID=A0A165RZ08_9AGAM|nr:hypothetical protein NEOLEDRAFT_1156717 [Neolentinus lepideus HHB14362 ss-1]